MRARACRQAFYINAFQIATSLSKAEKRSAAVLGKKSAFNSRKASSLRDPWIEDGEQASGPGAGESGGGARGGGGGGGWSKLKEATKVALRFNKLHVVERYVDEAQLLRFALNIEAQDGDDHAGQLGVKAGVKVVALSAASLPVTVSLNSTFKALVADFEIADAEASALQGGVMKAGVRSFAHPSGDPAKGTLELEALISEYSAVFVATPRPPKLS